MEGGREELLGLLVGVGVPKDGDEGDGEAVGNMPTEDGGEEGGDEDDADADKDELQVVEVPNLALVDAAGPYTWSSFVKVLHTRLERNFAISNVEIALGYHPVADLRVA